MRLCSSGVGMLASRTVSKSAVEFNGWPCPAGQQKDINRKPCEFKYCMGTEEAYEELHQLFRYVSAS